MVIGHSSDSASRVIQTPQPRRRSTMGQANEAEFDTCGRRSSRGPYYLANRGMGAGFILPPSPPLRGGRAPGHCAPAPRGPRARAPLDIIKARFAGGEIDKEEFEERRR